MPEVPENLMFLPLKSATPATAGIEVVPAMVLSGEVRVMVSVELVTVLPSASWMVTIGWGDQTVPEATFDGAAISSLLMAPKVRVKSW